MTDEKQREIFARNLKYYISKSGRQQKEIAEELKFNQKTFNGWCNALSMPTMGKVQTLADYFGIGKTDLIDEHVADGAVLTASERTLIEYYRRLNDAGRAVIDTQLAMMAREETYQKDTSLRAKTAT